MVSIGRKDEMNPVFRRFDTFDSLVDSAARYIVAAAVASVYERGFFTFVLAGGNTPRKLYEVLSEPVFSDSIPWHRTQIFFGDERCVPPGHDLSNYRMAHESLLSRVPVPAMNVHRIRCEETSPREAAESYEREIHDFCRLCDMDYIGMPSFDLILLGVGADGHTASLFPGADTLDEKHRLVVDTTAPAYAPVSYRITMTLPVLNAARKVLFLAAGDEKKETVALIFPPADSPVLPAGRVRAKEETLWFVDFDM